MRSNRLAFPVSFWNKVAVGEPEGCWYWVGSMASEGYGRFKMSGKEFFAHRVSYELVNGYIPVGLHLDHLCRNRACVNPIHLEAVTDRVNILRGEGVAAKNARKLTCPLGHAYEASKSRPTWRRCRICWNAYIRGWNKQKRIMPLPRPPRS